MRRYALTLLLFPGSALAASGAGEHDSGHALQLLFFASINFVIYVALLVVLLRKPVREFVAARYQGLVAQLDRVARERQALAARRSEAEARVAALNAEVQALEADIVQAARQEAARKLATARDLATAITNSAAQRIAAMERATEARILQTAAARLVGQAGEATAARVNEVVNRKIADRLAAKLGAQP